MLPPHPRYQGETSAPRQKARLSVKVEAFFQLNVTSVRRLLVDIVDRDGLESPSHTV
jgi:hypothetical protein